MIRSFNDSIFLFLELHRPRVHAVAFAGGGRAIVKDMPEVAAAAGASDFGAVTVRVGQQLDMARHDRPGEARPAGAGIELVRRAEQLQVAGGAAISPVVVIV